MIKAYFRPSTIEEAICFLQKDPQTTFALGGGNILSQNEPGKITVVDLQNIGLDKITMESGTLSMGACVTLQSLIEDECIPQVIKEAAAREGTINIRRTATLAGTLVSQRAASPLGAVLTAMNAKIVTGPGGSAADIKTWAGSLSEGKPARLVTRIDIPPDGKTAYVDISKTPADMPVIYSTMGLAQGGIVTWCIGINKDSGLFISSGKNTEIMLQNAHSHYKPFDFYNSYLDHQIDVLFHRLSSTLNLTGRSV